MRVNRPGPLRNLCASDFIDRTAPPSTHRLPASGKTLSSRATAIPNVGVLDSGVAAPLLGRTPKKLAGRDLTSLGELGHILEIFVVGKLLKQASWLDGGSPGWGWRARDGHELDLFLERDNGATLMFEVKASGRVPSDHHNWADSVP